MKIGIVGSGYVGTTAAACLADLGHEVVNVDVDEDVVDAVNEGRSPIHEPGLDDLIGRHASETLRATTSYDALETTDVVLLCLPTPSKPDGSVDLGVFESGVERLGDAIADVENPPVVATKSTVVPGTNENVVLPALERRAGDVELAMNPEFLREGSAVDDFMDPDKIVIGGSEDAVAAVERLYEGIDDVPIVRTGLREAEMIKYANNAFLAAKVSLVNDIGNVCKEYGVDTYEVMDAVGLDHRIASAFTRSGLGWGGSCFPKDVDALRSFADERDYEPPVIDGAVAVNELQPRRMVDLLADHVEIDGARVAVLGLAFKPGTDDLRNSRALDLIDILVERGVDVVGHDPVAIEAARELRPSIEYAHSAEKALDDADAAMIATAWPDYDDLDYGLMDRQVVIDGRRVEVDRDALDVYEGLCW